MTSKSEYDVIVAGGGPSGLITAREIALAGLEVKVFEEDSEIGVPEHCDGLISMKALGDLGITSSRQIVRNEIGKAIFYSPGGIKAEIDATKQKVIVVSRACFDKELAQQATKHGAEIDTACRIDQIKEDRNSVNVDAGGRKLNSYVMVDARGLAGLVNNRHGILQAGKYLVQGKWFNRDTVEVYLDQDVTPGYFTWVIPLSENEAHVGAAGRMVNPFAVLDRFVQRKDGTILKRIAAPIYIGGPIERFVTKRIVTTGDAAGQTKPLTAGGIYSGGVAGILAGKAIHKSISDREIAHLKSYESAWKSVFANEFKVMLHARRLFEKMNNKQIDGFFRIIVSSEILRNVSLEGDFDFHSISLARILGFRSILQIAKVLSGKELRSILALIRPSRGRSHRFG
jgi:digeranylgeranylglycerophospholipid reductase